MQLAAFGVSSSLFALFLYLTLYMQNYLGLTPFGTGLRYLPVTVVSFLASPIAGMLLSRVPARVLLGVGLAGVGLGLYLMGGVERRRRVDDAARRVRDRRRGDGADQPGDRGRGRERGAEAAERDGGRYQRHVPAGRHLRGHRRVGSDLRGPRGAKVRELAAGTPAAAAAIRANSSRPRRRGIWTRRSPPSPQSGQAVANAAREGFLVGFNEVVFLGSLVCFAGAVLAVWLVRERDIEREAVVTEQEEEPLAVAA